MLIHWKLAITRDVKASRTVWPRGQIIRPRPHGIWPRPRRSWPHGLKHDINKYLQSSHRGSFTGETCVSEVQRLLKLKSYLVMTLAEIIDHL